MVSQISEPLNCMEILPILIGGFCGLKILVDDMELVGNFYWMIPPLDDTPPKFNMEPKKKSPEKKIPFGNHHFQVPC